MDRHKIDAELAARTDRTFDRARNVVELEVEEDLLAEILHRLDDVRTLSREQLQANLIETDGVANRLDLLHRLFTSLNIQRNNQWQIISFCGNYSKYSLGLDGKGHLGHFAVRRRTDDRVLAFAQIKNERIESCGLRHGRAVHEPPQPTG